MKLKFIASVSFVIAFNYIGYSQMLTLQDALNRTINQYDLIKAKQELISASVQNTTFEKQQYLPDFTFSAQQSFGTINAQHGPMYAYNGLASAATSMPLAEQNWNAAFGSLYFANVNWNFFTFGKIKNQIALADKTMLKAKSDLQQEIFNLQIKTIATYLNLLASQRVKEVQLHNWERATVFYEITLARAKSGLIPEVDAQLAKAEVSNAKSLQLKAYDKELEFSKQLAVLLNEDFRSYDLDNFYSTTIPYQELKQKDSNTASHPFIAYQQSKIDESMQLSEIFRTNKRPNISAFGVIQARGSGFSPNYAQDLSAYSSNYFKGVGIDRGNYLFGVAISWNLTNFFRAETKVKEQQFLTKSMQFQLEAQQKELLVLTNQAHLQLKNAYKNNDEVKIQLEASQMAYKQQIALYENGLSNLVDFTQALYSLNRAEIEHEIAKNNLWQVLLLLASAEGNLNVFFLTI